MNSDHELSLYDYDLSPERIAQVPAPERTDARLMVLERSSSAPPSHFFIRDLPELLRPGDLLVRNNARVFPARLWARRPGGGRVELLLLSALQPSSDAPLRWRALARPAKRLKIDSRLRFRDGSEGVLLALHPRGEVEIAFPSLSGHDFFKWLEEVGEIPLPPYIRRGAEGPTPLDQERYQTTYASVACAVAAPTAGLHFTPELDQQLLTRGIEIVELTLAVGPGTFRPIVATCLEDHTMEKERYWVSEESAQRITKARREHRRILAVGTTTTRVLETVTDEEGFTHPGEGWTELFLRPGHPFRGIDGLLTNFHLPRSSLLVLVCAFAGRERILNAYAEAIQRGYRFYSYGDAMLILP